MWWATVTHDTAFHSTRITFDDGAYDWRQNLLDLWNPSGHKVTFFVNGFVSSLDGSCGGCSTN